MSTATPPAAPAADRPSKPPAPAPAAVIRRLGGAEETGQERLVKKHLPAWVMSGAVHLAVVAVLFFFFSGTPTPAPATEKVLNTSVEKEAEESNKDLTNEDPGLESNLAAALPDIAREAERNVESLVTDDPIGVPDATKQDVAALAPPGLQAADLTAPGVAGTTGDTMMGGGGMAGNISASFTGRSGATKNHLLRAGGGNEASELAVARGLAWLARQQKKDGSWVYDGTSAEDKIAATGMSLLPFLAAGQTHKPGSKYAAVVERGLKYLIANLKSNGEFTGQKLTMYSHGIATTALCEAYGMSKDKSLLLRPAQAAVSFIATKQAADGSWGYSPGTAGDTSIVGWQVQALKAAQLTKDITVPPATIKNAVAFLDKVSSGSRKAVYGYQTAAQRATAGSSLTAVGLLCRYYIDGWRPDSPGMAEGVTGLMKKGPKPPPAKPAEVKPNERPDMYYYYYATQVVHFADGPEWKDWNEGPMKDGKRSGGMRDWLIALQTNKSGTPEDGCWEPGGTGLSIGAHCGRVGTTAMSLLTLEVYYRHLPLYKRDTGALPILDGVK